MSPCLDPVLGASFMKGLYWLAGSQPGNQWPCGLPILRQPLPTHQRDPQVVTMEFGFGVATGFSATIPQALRGVGDPDLHRHKAGTLPSANNGRGSQLYPLTVSFSGDRDN